MPGDIDTTELGAVGQRRIGEAEIDREPAPLLFRQSVGINSSQRADQRRLAMIDMAGRRQDHGFGSSRADVRFRPSFPRKRESRGGNDAFAGTLFMPGARSGPPLARG